MQLGRRIGCFTLVSMDLQSSPVGRRSIMMDRISDRKFLRASLHRQQLERFETVLCFEECLVCLRFTSQRPCGRTRATGAGIAASAMVVKPFRRCTETVRWPSSICAIYCPTLVVAEQSLHRRYACCRFKRFETDQSRPAFLMLPRFRHDSPRYRLNQVRIESCLPLFMHSRSSLATE